LRGAVRRGPRDLFSFKIVSSLEIVSLYDGRVDNPCSFKFPHDPLDGSYGTKIELPI